uniref:Btz domain-containing protein n=1 Tax=Schistocephalus solidus TaxID=70667 RepID=A0A0X3NJH4_SCHSO
MTEVMSTNPMSNPTLPPKTTDSAADLSKASPNSQLQRRRRSWTRSSSRSRSRSRSIDRRRYRRSRRNSPPRSRLPGRLRERSPRRHSSRSPSHHRYRSRPRSGNRLAVGSSHVANRWPDGSGGGGGGSLDYPGMPNRDRSSLHFGNRTPPPRNRTPSYHSVVGEKSSSPTVPTLDERFRQLVETVSRRKPEYGVPGGLAHLVLSNRPRMPLPTLIRQARELSVVIERQLPPEIANPKATIVFDLDIRRAPLVLPRSPNEGSRPVFDRPEIPNYDKPQYLDEITRRLSAVLSAKTSRGTTYAKPYNNRDAGNFEYRPRGSAYSRPVYVGPADVPKGPSYFLHDDRDAAQSFRSRFRGNSSYSRTDWRQTSDKDYYGGRYRGRNRSRYSPDVENGSPQRQRRRPPPGGGGFENSRWTHDKYLELEHESSDRRPPDSYSPSSPTLSISEKTKDGKSQYQGGEGDSSATPKRQGGARMETEAPSSDD